LQVKGEVAVTLKKQLAGEKRRPLEEETKKMKKSPKTVIEVGELE
jgi:hypothetical protein